MRRKRFQRGCVRKVRHGRRWVWIGKYREDGIGRTKVLGHCADLTEGGAWAKLQEHLRPLNERAGQRQALPTNFRAYVSNVYLPQRRKKWKDSTDQTTTERIGTHLITAFESFDLSDLYPGSTAEVSRRQGTLAVAERGKPSSVGLERDLQDGCGGFDRPRQFGGFARYAERSENSGKTYDDQRTGPVGPVSLGPEGQDHFSACSFGRDAARRNSCAAMGKG